jgi:hypothetical protein
MAPLLSVGRAGHTIGCADGVMRTARAVHGHVDELDCLHRPSLLVRLDQVGQTTRSILRQHSQFPCAGAYNVTYG